MLAAFSRCLGLRNTAHTNPHLPLETSLGSKAYPQDFCCERLLRTLSSISQSGAGFARVRSVLECLSEETASTARLYGFAEGSCSWFLLAVSDSKQASRIGSAPDASDELILHRLLELKKTTSTRWPPPGPPQQPAQPASTYTYNQPSTLLCAIPVFKGDEIACGLLLEAHPQAPRQSMKAVVRSSSGDLLASPGALQQLSLAASVALSVDVDEIAWLAGALARVAASEGMQGLVELLAEVVAEHVQHRFAVGAVVRVALLPSPHAATGLLFQTSGVGPSSAAAAATVPTSPSLSPEESLAPPALAMGSQVQGRGGGGGGGGGGGAARLAGSGAAAGSGGASRRRLAAIGPASATGSDCGTLASRTGHASCTSERQASISAPSRTATTAGLQRTIVVQLPPHLALDAPPPSLYAQAFLLKHTLLQSLAAAAEPPHSFGGVCIEDVGAHVNNVHNPSRDVCMLMGCGSGGAAAGGGAAAAAASARPASTVGGGWASASVGGGGSARSASGVVGRSLRPSSSTSIGSGPVGAGGGGGGSPQSLVLLGLPLGEGGCVLGLYLCFPRRLPGGLLEAVRASGQRLMEQVLAGPVRARLAGPLAPEFEALRTTTPGSFAVLRSQTASGLLQRPASAGSGFTAVPGGGVAIGKSPLSTRLGGLLVPPQGGGRSGESPRVSPALPLRPGGGSPDVDDGPGLALGGCGEVVVLSAVAPQLPKGLSLYRGVSFSHESRNTAGGAAAGSVAHSVSFSIRRASTTLAAAGSGGGADADARDVRDHRITEPRNWPRAASARLFAAAAIAAATAAIASGGGNGTSTRASSARGGGGGAAAAAAADSGTPQLLAPVDNSELLNAFIETDPGSSGGVGSGEATGCGLVSGLVGLLGTGTGLAGGGGGGAVPAPNALSASVMTISGVDAAASKRQQLDLMLRSMQTTVAPDGERDTTPTNWDDLEEIELYEVLGKGGGGVVFRGRLGTHEVAVKVMELPDVDVLDALSGTNMMGAAMTRMERAAVGGGAGAGGNGGLAAGAGAVGGADAEAGLRAGLPLRPAAVALLAAEQLRARKALLRNATEMAVHGQVSHPNLLQVYATYPNVVLAQRSRTDGGVCHCLLPADSIPLDACQGGSAPTCCAIVTELADCGCLASALASRAFPLPRMSLTAPSMGVEPSLLVDMRAVYLTLLDVALALRHLHGCGLVHRDVKPANLLLRSAPRDPRGFTVKLADFGFVLRLGEAAEDGTRFAVADQACGTVTHMAPELLSRDARVTSAADVYSFGILMWELLAGGSRPFPHLTPDQIPRHVASGARPVFGHNVPLSYRSLASACWTADVTARPKAGDLVRLISGFLQGPD